MKDMQKKYEKEIKTAKSGNSFKCKCTKCRIKEKKKAGSGCKDEEMRSKVYTTCEIPLGSKVEVWKYLHGNGN